MGGAIYISFMKTPAAAVAFLSAAIISPHSVAHAQDSAARSLGPFTFQSDIGIIRHAGDASFDPVRSSFVVSGSGANMWFTNDAFHFVWKQVSGNVSLNADIHFVDKAGVDHRKACLVIRQSLEPGSAYVDAAVHASGLTSLQYRDGDGETTHEIQLGSGAPARLGLQKRGDYFYLTSGGPDNPLEPTGASIRVAMKEPFYVGLGVCSHDADAVAKAEFDHVQLTALAPVTGQPVYGGSSLEVVPLGSKDRRIIYQTNELFEAPNWTRDGKNFIFNSHGHLYKLPVKGGQPELIDTGFAVHCNNDHGISPDGTQLAISDQTKTGKSLVYILPLTGGAPKLVTADGPSYWHGWSPDGSTLAFCGERKGEFDVYSIPAAGGEETRLTTAPGLDDGPDFSPDGKFIYFNSVRSGHMQIWRMKADGSEQTQLTSDDNNNWFAHPSPDGKWIAFLSFGPTVTGHPANEDVGLRLMPANGGKIETLAKLFGGQGTINVPSWSPDSKEIAFVSYLPKFSQEAGRQ